MDSLRVRRRFGPCPEASVAKVKTNIIYENNLPLCRPNLALSLGGRIGPRAKMKSQREKRKELL